MSELNCSVVADLLPLYAEDLVSPETRAQVDAHLEGCADCRARLERLDTRVPVPPEENLRQAAPLKKMYGWLVLLILGSPIWFSLLVAGAAVVVSVYISLLSVLLCLWCVPVSFAACTAAGLLGFGFALSGGILWQVPALLGCALVGAGVATASALGCWKLSRWFFGGTRRVSVWFWHKITGKKSGV